MRNALQSILKAHQLHPYWELAFGDDGSLMPGRPIVEEILHEHLDRVTFVDSGQTFEDKIKHGLILGKMANEAIQKSSADVGIILCDDDELVPDYLKNLSNFFSKHPNVKYCYSKIHLYNPLFQKSDKVDNIVGKFNANQGAINPINHVDATQVAWRLSCCKTDGAWFRDNTKEVEGKPWVKDTDKSFFENLYRHCGDCVPTGFVGQYKGIHEYQLLWHKNAPAACLWSYDKMCRELGGKQF